MWRRFPAGCPAILLDRVSCACFASCPVRLVSFALQSLTTETAIPIMHAVIGMVTGAVFFLGVFILFALQAYFILFNVTNIEYYEKDNVRWSMCCFSGLAMCRGLERNAVWRVCFVGSRRCIL